MRAELSWFLGCVAALGCGDVASSSEPLPASLTLLHTSDLHSQLWPFRTRISRQEAALGLGEEGSLAEVGGAARLASLLSAERATGASLWLDSGDALEGAPVFHRYGGRVEVELLQALGLSAMALGNHELSLAGPELGDLFGAARFPVLAANATPHEGSPLAAWLRPSVTLLAGALRVAVVGLANPDSPPDVQSASNLWGLEMAADLAASVQAAVDDVAPRAALVVVLSHVGLDADRGWVKGTSGVDLVLGGHQHVLTAEPEWLEDCSERALQRTRGCAPRRVPLVHSGAYGQFVSRLKLGLRADPSRPGALDVSRLTLTHLPVAQDVPHDASVAEYLERYRAEPAEPLAFVADPVTRAAPLGGDSPLGNLTADALLAATGADLVLLNSSGLRADLEAGPLLADDLGLAFPFDEPWRLVWASGAELQIGLLRAARKSASRGCSSSLQLAGARWVLRCAACQQERRTCSSVTRGEQPLTEDERLLIALPVYLTRAGADFDWAAARGAELQISPSEALARFVRTAPGRPDPRDCQRALVESSPARCAAAFGALCPLPAARAEAICRQLPLIGGTRDGRIQALP